MNIRLLGKLVLLFAVLIIGQNQTAHAYDLSHQEVPGTLTMASLGMEDVTITGLDNSVSIHFPLPSNWLRRHPAQVTLVYQASPLLDTERTSVTISANSLPITSIHPVVDSQEHTIGFEVPPDRLNAENLELRFDVRLFLAGDINCPEADNPGQWFTVRNTTKIQLVVDEDIFNPTLADLPAAIVVQNSIDAPPDVIFVLPDDFDASDLTVAARVAARLGRETGSGIFPFQARTASSLADIERTQANLVIVGLPDKNQMFEVLASSLPVHLNKNEFEYPEGGKVAGNTAVIQILNSLWNPARKMLLVSGTDQAGLDLAGQAFADNTTYTTLTGQSQLVMIDRLATNPIESAQQPWLSDTTSLSDLGFRDVVLDGMGLVEASYYFRLPPGWILEPGSQVTLHMTYSTALTDDSHVTVSVNGEPIGVFPIDIGDTSKTVTFPLPDRVRDTLVSGSRAQTMNIRISARNFLDLINCQPSNASAAWISVIAADSTLYAPHHIMPIPDLLAFPYPFVGSSSDDPPTNIILPAAATTDEIAEGLSLATSLGRFNLVISNLSMVTYSETLEASLADFNLIILGSPERQPLVGKLLQSFNSDVTRLATEALSNPLMGVLLEISSYWNPERTTLVVTGNSQEAFKSAADALFAAAPPVQQSGSLAIIEPQQGPHIIYSASGQTVLIEATKSPVQQPENMVTAMPMTTPEIMQPQPELPLPSGQLVALVVVPPLIIGLVALVWVLRTRISR
ncbi:MAG: cellulose biosynthesis cyclic di-GMP-binding regulatory protein BcsB [Anaerolineae bacterium]|nr:cellulose biosynthesis cyclic di-GMP-binding regulatory protein BcsB [Anaerolineae bacterium]